MNSQNIQFSLDTRASLVMLTGILGIIWQGAILTFGGEPSRDLIGASVTLILASLGIGFKRESNNGSDNSSTTKNSDEDSPNGD
jgi:hypothetical protein